MTDASALLMNRPIDPDTPISDAGDMLRAAHGVIAAGIAVMAATPAPVVRHAPTRAARPFRRARPRSYAEPILDMRAGVAAPTTQVAARGNGHGIRRGGGATRFFRRSLAPAFRMGAGAAFTPKRRLRMASALLFAGAQPRARIARARTPVAEPLLMLRARSAQAAGMRALLQRAQYVRGVLTQRFAANGRDWQDGHADMARTMLAQRRYHWIAYAI
ncbi:MAG: hypothetical protein H6865_02895 [Rhodospirillales bacterium]|nr:hypothetical protein [Alphaproteobacteria bacterium]MCB9986564.1 hypothetical protein [Rhodospirillales bacterium]USO06903.1 MAG: hypothetical protein H6866_05490 [Rhodospirillales bacterium]